MKAYELAGVGIERLHLVDRQALVPRAREVLIQMNAAAVNARDLQILGGHYPIGKPLPLVPLSDGVGRVVRVGDEVTRVRPGDRVAGIFAQRWLDGPRVASTWPSTLGGDLDGVLQEQVVLDEAGVVKVPSHLTDEEAATLPTAAVTAWQALVTRGAVKAGDTVLVRSTGGVGLFALQFARAAGARVIVTSQSSAKRERVLALGASEVVDSTSADWVRKVVELTDGEGADHVVDVVGDLEASIRCVRVGGVISQIGYLASMRLEAQVIPLLLSNTRLHGISVGPRSTFEEMNRAITVHNLRPVVDSVTPFARAPETFAAFASERRLGKVVIKF